MRNHKLHSNKRNYIPYIIYSIKFVFNETRVFLLTFSFNYSSQFAFVMFCNAFVSFKSILR